VANISMQRMALRAAADAELEASMKRDFEIVDGIFLVQSSYKLDLHNNFDFLGLNYSVKGRTLLLRWRRSDRPWVAPGTPESVEVEFREVSEFRFNPRDAALPFTEDECVNSLGYWVDEDWAEGVVIAEPYQNPDKKWMTAIDFMSGAVIVVQATSAHAEIMA
jgi:hypothetical protein